MRDGNDRYIKIIKDYMEDFNLTQQDVADRLEVSQPTVNSWLTGKTGITQRNRARIDIAFGNSASSQKHEYEDILDAIVSRVLNSTTLSAQAKAEVYDIIKEEKER